MIHVVLNLDIHTDQNRETLFWGQGQTPWWYGGDDRDAVTSEFAQSPQEAGPFCLWLHTSAWGSSQALAEFIYHLHPAWSFHSWLIAYSGGGAVFTPTLAAVVADRGLALEAFVDPFPTHPSCPTYPAWQGYLQRFAQGHYGPRYQMRQHLLQQLEQEILRGDCPDPGLWQALLNLYPEAVQPGLHQAWEMVQADSDAVLDLLDNVAEQSLRPFPEELCGITALHLK